MKSYVLKESCKILQTRVIKKSTLTEYVIKAFSIFTIKKPTNV